MQIIAYLLFRTARPHVIPAGLPLLPKMVEPEYVHCAVTVQASNGCPAEKDTHTRINGPHGPVAVMGERYVTASSPNIFGMQPVAVPQPNQHV